MIHHGTPQHPRSLAPVPFSTSVETPWDETGPRVSTKKSSSQRPAPGNETSSEHWAMSLMFMFLKMVHTIMMIRSARWSRSRGADGNMVGFAGLQTGEQDYGLLLPGSAFTAR